MSDTATVKLSLPLIQAAEAQKHVTHNEALDTLDALVHLAVLDRDLTAPPASPADGDAYIPAAGAGGEWSGRDNDVVVWQGGLWRHYSPQTGWRAFIIDEQKVFVWDGSAWTSIADFATPSELQNVTLFGLGTTADAANPFSAKLNDCLFTARYAAESGTGDLRCTLNKEAAANNLSLLMKHDWSARAELGLLGNDEFTLKMSADGTNWKKAIEVDAEGHVKLPQRPLFMGRRTAGDMNASGVFVTDQVLVDTAAAYNTANGRFTCPVAGVFQVHGGVLFDINSATGSWISLEVRKNGVTVGSAIAFARQETAARYVFPSAAGLVSVSAGDYLEFHVNLSAGALVYGTGYNFLLIKQEA